MRMRKKKWAEPYLCEHDDYALENPVSYKGGWKKLLGCTVLHVEIGTGKGDYLNQMAAMYPEEGWVGIEKDRNAAAVACRKAVEGGDLHKQKLIVNDGEHLLDWFDENEIDMIHLNFSDPWPKKYTHKRRLSSARFLSMYQTVLSTEGCIRMKTDNQDLFEDSVLYFQQAGFMLDEISVNYRRNPHPEDAITEYESRFMELQQPIYRLQASLHNGCDSQINMIK